MKRRPARLETQPKRIASVAGTSPASSPACPLSNPPPPDSLQADLQAILTEPPPLEAIYAALDRISEEWGIKL